MGARMGETRLRHRRISGHGCTPSGAAIVCHPIATPQCDGYAAHGACVQPNHHGQPDALPPHDGGQHGVDSRHRPRWYCHANRGGTPVARPKAEPPRPGPRSLCEKSLGVEGKERQHHHHPNAPHGRQRGLEPRILHDGRAPLQNRDRDLCAALQRGLDLPWQAPRELGPGADERGERLGSGKRRRRRQPLAHPLPLCRRPANGQRRTGGRFGGGHNPP